MHNAKMGLSPAGEQQSQNPEWTNKAVDLGVNKQ